MTASCSQFRINKDGPVELTVSGPKKYAYLTLDGDQTKAINSVAKKVGEVHERGPSANKFMVYSGTFLPGLVKGENDSRVATVEEKNLFRQIGDVAVSAIAKKMGVAVSSDDVEKLVLETTVDFSFMEANRASQLRIELSQAAFERLNLDKDPKFRPYGIQPSNKGEVAVQIFPGQIF